MNQALHFTLSEHLRRMTSGDKTAKALFYCFLYNWVWQSELGLVKKIKK